MTEKRWWADTQLRWVAVAGSALVIGFLMGLWRAGPIIDTGRVDSMGDGGGTIFTDDWSYGFSAEVAWTDAGNGRHEGGTPDCLPPLSSVEGVRFAYVEVTFEGATWRPVLWIDCRGVPPPSEPPAASLTFRTADPPDPPASGEYGCAGVGFDPVVFHGSQVGADTLVWVDDPNQRQVALVWPHGFSVRFDPQLQLLDGDGSIVARDGDTIELGGAFDPEYSNLFLVWEVNRVQYGCW
jgi:hypothetical protein